MEENETVVAVQPVTAVMDNVAYGLCKDGKNFKIVEIEYNGATLEVGSAKVVSETTEGHTHAVERFKIILGNSKLFNLS